MKIDADATTVPAAHEIEFVPTPAYGRRLLELRQWMIAAGQGLATDEEFERELAERRGGVYLGDDE